MKLCTARAAPSAPHSMKMTLAIVFAFAIGTASSSAYAGGGVQGFYTTIPDNQTIQTTAPYRSTMCVATATIADSTGNPGFTISENTSTGNWVFVANTAGTQIECWYDNDFEAPEQVGLPTGQPCQQAPVPPYGRCTYDTGLLGVNTGCWLSALSIVLNGPNESQPYAYTYSDARADYPDWVINQEPIGGGERSYAADVCVTYPYYTGVFQIFAVDQTSGDIVLPSNTTWVCGLSGVSGDWPPGLGFAIVKSNNGLAGFSSYTEGAPLAGVTCVKEQP